MILAADIGGTNARLGLFERTSRLPLHLETFPSSSVSCVEELLDRFLPTEVAIDAACLAVAGPVHDGRSRAVNLPWDVDAAAVGRALGLDRAELVNDLEANARGILLLGPDDLFTINTGEPERSGACAIVSAGTGLGEAGLIRVGDRYMAIAGEGGHADFAPRSPLEVELFQFLAAEYDHVSYERVCSGMGIANIYRFVSGNGRSATPAAVTQAADEDPVADETLRLFCSIYGACAANVALAFLATGGVYLGGGIAPRIAKRLADGTFMEAFTAKGRMSALLAKVPVHVVLNDRTALLGAAEIARDGLRAQADEEMPGSTRANWVREVIPSLANTLRR